MAGTRQHCLQLTQNLAREAEEAKGETASEYQQQLQRMQSQLGNQFGPELAKQMGMPAQVLDQMVGQALFGDLAHSLGLRAPDDVITAILASVPGFKDQAGQFDQDRFGG